jgi:hypothetical protein
VDDGVPVLDASLELTDDRTSTAEMLRFLEGGSEVLGAPGLSEDWLDPAHSLVVPMGFRTDGTWLWSVELAFYLREHGVIPEKEFVAHMAALRFVAKPASPDDVRSAEEMLRGASAS